MIMIAARRIPGGERNSKAEKKGRHKGRLPIASVKQKKSVEGREYTIPRDFRMGRDTYLILRYSFLLLFC